ncbi:hypothetical protein [Winogradskyella flava]|uniref:Uncharacterized protein n=1 Tax=Winogradskyella flava TaxID=1884876 RepID=A0A842IXB0_9FLAO|nr:hypothetical protein [Winogradskyella flava]MBC2845418.1 hypothetical protein [Winogradskyella flava]
MNTNPTPKTIAELQQWLKAQCHYNLSYYNIDGTTIYEGYCIKIVDGVYQWCFHDRSHREVVVQFKNEKDIVSYAHKEITSNSWTKNNLVGIFKPLELNTILKSINKLDITYNTDQLFYGKDDVRTRVFVTGCDIKKVTHLIKSIYK